MYLQIIIIFVKAHIKGCEQPVVFINMHYYSLKDAYNYKNMRKVESDIYVQFWSLQYVENSQRK